MHTHVHYTYTYISEKWVSECSVIASIFRRIPTEYITTTEPAVQSQSLIRRNSGWYYRQKRAKNQKEIYKGPRQHFVHTYIHRKEKLRTHFTYLHTYIHIHTNRKRERETIKDRVKWINNTSNNRRLAVAVASPTIARTWKLKQLSPSSNSNKANAFNDRHSFGFIMQSDFHRMKNFANPKSMFKVNTKWNNQKILKKYSLLAL